MKLVFRNTFLSLIDYQPQAIFMQQVHQQQSQPTSTKHRQASASTEHTIHKTKLRVAINGFGRIGRNLLRAMLERQVFFEHDVEVVAINDISDPHTLLHLLKYDSTHGRLSDYGFQAWVEQVDSETPQASPQKHVTHLQLSTKLPQQHIGKATHTRDLQDTSENPHTKGLPLNIASIIMLSQENPEKLPWDALSVDVVLECTGCFRSYQAANKHRQAGAKQVIIGAAPFDAVDACVVVGVNEHMLNRQLPIISSVSCTTQALVPLIDSLHKSFGVTSAMMTEIHAVTADQNVLDQPHRDIRRARASGYNIIPTTSSSIAATERVLPDMVGRINGYSMRVPTIDVAAIDVTFTFAKTVTLAEVKQCLQTHSQNKLFGIMGYTDEALVSSDFIHQPESLVVDELQMMQVGEQVKVFAWYDNEWGYSNRLVDMCVLLSTGH